QASLSQTVPISGDQSLELLVSLSKYSLATSPAISFQVVYLNADNAEVGRGLDVEIPYNSLPNAMFGSWRVVYQVTGPAPASATQARVVISQAFSLLFSQLGFVAGVTFYAFYRVG